MAVRRFDSNNGDFITLAIGAVVGINTGAFTIAVLAKKEADGAFFPAISAENGASSRRSLWTTDTDVVMSNTGGFNIDTPVTFEQTDDWAVIAVTKPAGEELIRGHKGVLGGAWTHTNGDEGFDDTQAVDNIKLGSWQDGAHWHGLIAVAAMWERELSDAELEDGFTTSAASWLAASPDGMWLLNQAATSTVVEDVTEGGADQTAITGTTVVTDDDPPGFSFDLDAGETVTGTGAAALGALTATAAGTRTVHGTAASALGALTAAAAGTRQVAGLATASLGALAVTATGQRTINGAALAGLGVLTAAAAGQRTIHATAAANLGGILASATSGDTSVAGAATLLAPARPTATAVTPLVPTAGGVQ